MDKDFVPEEALFFIADGFCRSDQVLRAIYGNPWYRTREHFLRINTHLEGGRILPGQMVVNTPADSQTCQRWELVMLKLAG